MTYNEEAHSAVWHPQFLWDMVDNQFPEIPPYMAAPAHKGRVCPAEPPEHAYAAFGSP